MFQFGLDSVRWRKAFQCLIISIIYAQYARKGPDIFLFYDLLLAVLQKSKTLLPNFAFFYDSNEQFSFAGGPASPQF
jgi:hypothetical protein